MVSRRIGIRLARFGCANRPFYHIVVAPKSRRQKDPPLEQLGTYDIMPNEHKERMVSLNLERIQYWIGVGAHISDPVAELLGLAGFLPIHPLSYMKAWRNRRKANTQAVENQTLSSEVFSTGEKGELNSSCIQPTRPPPLIHLYLFNFACLMHFSFGRCLNV
ncbi:mitochondrial ribosomal protein S16 isoform X2 [Tachypleus tridentatus]